MYKLTALTIVAALVLSACGTTPETLIMSRRTGLTGSGDITSGVLRNSGELTIGTRFETFTGRWVAVREGANQGLELLQAYAGGSLLRGTANLISESEAGYGTAILTSDGGRSMRCEFRYTGVQITAIGVCETTDGEVFDFQIG
ncbi:hypothetical protein [Gymnodinialimonas sp.]